MRMAGLGEPRQALTSAGLGADPRRQIGRQIECSGSGAIERSSGWVGTFLTRLQRPENGALDLAAPDCDNRPC
jgi:hypothetical protein